jgi:hypothetical protein
MTLNNPKSKRITNTILSLAKSLIPVLALSLTVITLAGGRVSAASVSDNVVLNRPGTGYIAPYNGDLTPYMSGSVAPYNININAPSDTTGVPSIYTFVENPCLSTPVDLTLNMIYTAWSDADPLAGDRGDFFVAITNLLDFPPSSSYQSPDLSNIIGIQQNVSITATGLTGAQLAIGLADQGWHYTNGAGDNIDISSFTYTLSYPDNMSDCSYASPSSPPATEPDTSTTPPLTPVTLNILSNDTGSNLTITKIDNQSITPGQTITLSNGSGTVTLNTDGTITFTPANGFTGQSNFSYSISDGTTEIGTGVVVITVSEDAVPTATNTTTNNTNNPTANTNKPTLAKTGSNLRLILTLSIVAVVLGLSLKNFAKN